MLSRIRLFYDVEQESGKTPGALAGTTVLYPGTVCEIRRFFLDWIVPRTHRLSEFIVAVVGLSV